MNKLIVYWFRNDLRRDDNPALNHACDLAKQSGAKLLPVFCHTASYGVLRRFESKWGFVRASAHRKNFLREGLRDLRIQLHQSGFDLLELDGEFSQQDAFWTELSQTYLIEAIVCEQIAAPEEISQVDSLRAQKFAVQTVWQSSMYDPVAFDFDVKQMPDQFTAFRHIVEKAAYSCRQPVLNALSKSYALLDPTLHRFAAKAPVDNVDNVENSGSAVQDDRSSFPYWRSELGAGSQAALRHLSQYFSSNLPHQYKQTRNQLHGTTFSTKFSPWLASGALSASQIIAALRKFEDQRGKSESSYWIWFELLWRDYFRFLHIKYGALLYGASGLSKTSVSLPAFDARKFQMWTQSNTGEPLIDAAMRELSATGYLSNRLRQQVISYWLHELEGDWRVAAAWFESQLLDYDVYSNQGNCLYLAGLGTDPRGYLGGRWFDPRKQAKQHDADGSYRTLWNTF